MGLVLLDDVKDELNIQDTLHDSKLTRYIEAASAKVEKIVNRKLESTVYADEQYIGSDNVRGWYCANNSYDGEDGSAIGYVISNQNFIGA